MNVSIIILVYNEKQTLAVVIADTVRAFAACDFEIIVVDDGSTDGTQEILDDILQKSQSAYSLRVISHVQNLGKGAAIQSGLAIATRDFVAIQDADMEYQPEHLAGLWRHISLPTDVVYGVRSGKDGYIWNRIGNRVLSTICNILFHAHLSDIYTCYKIVPRELMLALALTSRGFEIEAEITAKILKRKIPITEIPIEYSPRKFSEGKKIRAADGVRGIWKLIRIFLA